LCGGKCGASIIGVRQGALAEEKKRAASHDATRKSPRRAMNCRSWREVQQLEHDYRIEPRRWNIFSQEEESERDEKVSRAVIGMCEANEPNASETTLPFIDVAHACACAANNQTIRCGGEVDK
jgi:hypothetical protein